MITEYEIIRDSSSIRLVAIVDDSIKAGWQPIGGVAVTVDSEGTTHFHQAIVRIKSNG